MTAIYETAYPRIRSSVTEKELAELYTPSPEELQFAGHHSKSEVARLGLLVLLKVFQRLGHVPADTEAIPASIVRHIALVSGLPLLPDSLQKYEQGRFRWRHVPLVRDFLDIRAWNDGGEQLLAAALAGAARSKDIIADIINAGIESLVRERYELPAFDTLLRAAKQARARANKTCYRQVTDALSETQKEAITQLLSRKDGETKSHWDALKREPGQPTVKRIREYAGHLRWLQSLDTGPATFTGIPETKLQRFAAEARALNVFELNRMPAAKRFTLAAALLRAQTAQAADDLTAMYIRRLGKLHWQAQEALRDYRLQNQEQTDALIRLLGQIAGGWEAGATPEQRHLTVDNLLGGQAETVRQQCEAHLGFAGNNYLPFLPKLFTSHRKVCFDILELLRPVSTTEDRSLEEAVAFLLRNRDARGERLPVAWTETSADGGRM